MGCTTHQGHLVPHYIQLRKTRELNPHDTFVPNNLAGCRTKPICTYLPFYYCGRRRTRTPNTNVPPVFKTGLAPTAHSPTICREYGNRTHPMSCSQSRRPTLSLTLYKNGNCALHTTPCIMSYVIIQRDLNPSLFPLSGV